ncbi:MAG: methionyl-tRNA formyltransferase [Solirubrobacterales bacterium]|nr:methionyl-tRNA formyltransferase [Solirubrobacterales bacterium]
MSIVYLGTSEFAAQVLGGLAAADHAPGLVVTPPDRPRGRGQRLASPPAAEAARELGIELLQAGGVNDRAAVERIRAAEPRLGVVCAFGQLIREPLLSELPLLNVHPSLLPWWRGAAPIERAIAAGDAETGVTIMRVTEGLDSGPIALRESLAVGDDDFGALAPRLARLGAELAVRALDRSAAGTLEWTEQDDNVATYAEKIRPEERRLDPGQPARELALWVRALTPHLGAYLELRDGERLGVRGAAAEPGTGPPGELEVIGDALRLACSPGRLRIELVQPAGGRPMGVGAYLRGHPPPRLS